MAVRRRRWVVKAGGSLSKAGALDEALAVVDSLRAAGLKIVVAPGGGEYADFIRRKSRSAMLDDRTSHLQAMHSVCQHGLEIAGRMRNFRAVESGYEARRQLSLGKTPVYLPDDGLCRRTGAPSSWDTTSDTLAAAICARMGFAGLIFLKCVDGAMAGGKLLAEVKASDKALHGILDPQVRRILRPGWDVFIINGQRPERIRRLLVDGSPEGTRIIP